MHAAQSSIRLSPGRLGRGFRTAATVLTEGREPSSGFALPSAGNHSQRSCGNHHASSNRVTELIEALRASATGTPRPFELSVSLSTIPGAGRGVFLQRGQLEPNQFVTLYPGTVYHLPFDLEAFTTGDDALDLRPPDVLIANDYLLRFKHGGPSGQANMYLIDGCPRGISALAFTRVIENRQSSANQSWLEEKGLTGTQAPSSAERQWALGHLLNDPEGEERTNVHFEILSLPRHVEAPLLALVPSLPVSVSERLVVAVTATKKLEGTPEQPVELFVSYGADPKALGYPI